MKFVGCPQRRDWREPIRLASRLRMDIVVCPGWGGGEQGPLRFQTPFGSFCVCGGKIKVLPGAPATDNIPSALTAMYRETAPRSQKEC